MIPSGPHFFLKTANDYEGWFDEHNDLYEAQPGMRRAADPEAVHSEPVVIPLLEGQSPFMSEVRCLADSIVRNERS